MTVILIYKTYAKSLTNTVGAGILNTFGLPIAFGFPIAFSFPKVFHFEENGSHSKSLLF